MLSHSDYQKIPLSANRKIVSASASVTSSKNTIHGFTEIDVTILGSTYV
ncbi:MAG TPA: hypothetical protein PK066_04735 [Saprospiraceae bacterium]|nr:hypothetical protein [Saprospiraceae bacterium]